MTNWKLAMVEKVLLGLEEEERTYLEGNEMKRPLREMYVEVINSIRSILGMEREGRMYWQIAEAEADREKLLGPAKE